MIDTDLSTQPTPTNGDRPKGSAAVQALIYIGVLVSWAPTASHPSSLKLLIAVLFTTAGAGLIRLARGLPLLPQFSEVPMPESENPIFKPIEPSPRLAGHYRRTLFRRQKGLRGRQLGPGEQVYWESRRHPISILHWRFLIFAVPPSALVVGALMWSTLPLWVGLAIAYFAGWKILDWHLTRLVLTESRIVEVKGILTAKSLMMPLSKVTDLTIITPAASRFLNWIGAINRLFGTVDIESAGQDQALKILTLVPDITVVGPLLLTASGVTRNASLEEE